MSATRKGMGQGLDALFRNMPSVSAREEKKDAPEPEAAPVSLPIAALTPGQGQPRRHFDENALEELAESIRSQGIVQPLLVRPCRTETATFYEIVAGERRWRAAQRAGLSEVPVWVREMTDEEALAAALIENLQREDLDPVEEARAIQTLRERLSLSQDEVARRIGKSRPAVANALRLLQLPEPMLEALRGGIFTPGHARSVLALSERALQDVLFQAVLDRHLSVRDTEAAVTYWRRHGVLPSGLMKAAAPAPRRERTPFVQQAIVRLRATVHPKASISGTERMGRISLPYESEEQLAALLHLLGQTEETPSSGDALSSVQRKQA